MTNQEILELMARFDASSLTSFKLHSKDADLEMGKGIPAAPAAAPRACGCPGGSRRPRSGPGRACRRPPRRKASASTAPVVGTFYMAPAPDQPPFVQVGDKVQKGQTVCLMEAMKMMSEVKAPCDCVIEAILQEDRRPGVLWGRPDPLPGRVRPCSSVF